MKLVCLVTEQYYTNPWGLKELRGDLYRAIETVEVEPNGEHKMFDNGYEPPYPCPILAAADGRTWCQIQNRIDYWGGTWYRPLFERPRDPALSKNEIGPTVGWEPEEKARKRKLVNAELQPVNYEGNVL